MTRIHLVCLKGMAMLLLLAVLGAACAMCVFAEQNRVFDMDDLLTPEQESALEETIAQTANSANADVGIVTIVDNEGKGAKLYADDFYEEQNMGYGSGRSGVLLLIDMHEREVAISTDGQMIRILTDARIDTMLDHVIDCLAEEDYLGACEAFLEDVQYYAALGVPSDQYNYDSETGEVDSYAPTRRSRISTGDLVVYLLGSLVVAGVATGIVFYRYSKDGSENAYPLREKTALALQVNSNVLVNRTVTQRRIQHNSSGGSSSRSRGSRSTTTRSSSGRRHGGGSRRF